MTKKIQLNSTITCPDCGFKKEEIMPTDSCQFFYECTNCRKILKPKAGDCCVYCSCGSVKCPPIQKTGKCNCWLKDLTVLKISPTVTIWTTPSLWHITFSPLISSETNSKGQLRGTVTNSILSFVIHFMTLPE